MEETIEKICAKCWKPMIVKKISSLRKYHLKCWEQLNRERTKQLYILKTKKWA